MTYRSRTGSGASPEMLRTAKLALRVAEQLDCPRLNLHGTGLDDQGLPVIPNATASPAMWLTAARTLIRLANPTPARSITRRSSVALERFLGALTVAPDQEMA